MEDYRMELTREERDILAGSSGPVVQKVLRSVVLYGEAFDATRLIPISGRPHLAMSFGASILKSYYGLLDALIDESLETLRPFTTNPRTYDPHTTPSSFFENLLFRYIYGAQKNLERQLDSLGLIDSRSYSCTSYLPEVGNTPSFGDILAWSESSAVVFVNSVIGARTNRNSTGIDILMNIINRAPLFGLLNDDGRRADWLVEIKTDTLPNPQLLGSAVGMKVMEDVPYIGGLEALLKGKSDAFIRDYLKDFGAATASNGAVGLFHIEHITPEAKTHGDSLLRLNHHTYVITDEELSRIRNGYKILWKRPDLKPKRCFIGCPHLSLEQVADWAAAITQRLDSIGKTRVSMPVVLTAAPEIMRIFREKNETASRLERAGVYLSSVCPVAFMSNPISSKIPVITNSNKLRTYTTARFYPDDETLAMICG
ncbi:MAG: DUF521 domain-containing protein [Deltaproteobacteria bacterium]|nr:DUF521 domain-containing protein [Candidatus Zymogenaceae bacterium]